MGYIANRETDIFVSFAEEDNAVFPNTDRGWVDTLAEYLRKLVESQGINGVTIRTSVPGNLPDRGRLESLTQAALVLTVLSPSYLQSQWLEDEHCRARLFGIATAEPARLFIACKGKVPDEPNALKPIRRHDFWYPDGDIIRTLGVPGLLPGQQEPYYAVVTALASALAEGLRRLKPPESGAVSATLSPGPPKPTIYLAEAPSALKEKREVIRNYMDQIGIDVVPRGLLPDDIAELRRVVATELSTCRAFVQLLGERPGDAGDRATMERAATELDAAQTAASAGLRIFQWRDPSLVLANVADPRQRALLQRDTVCAESVDDFCHAVRLAATAKPAPPPGGRPIVFVDVERNQLHNAKRIFVERYMRIAWDLNEVKKFGALRNRLDQVRGVIMFWGAGDSSGTVDRYYEFRKRWKQLKKRDELLCIYDGPPPDKPDFAGGNFPIIMGRRGEDTEELRRFVQQVLSNPA